MVKNLARHNPEKDFSSILNGNRRTSRTRTQYIASKRKPIEHEHQPITSTAKRTKIQIRNFQSTKIQHIQSKPEYVTTYPKSAKPKPNA